MVAGEKVTAEQQVVNIVDLRMLELAGTVGTQDVARLSAGMPVELKIEGVDKPMQGKLARIAPQAEAARARSAWRCSCRTRRRRCAPASTPSRRCRSAMRRRA